MVHIPTAYSYNFWAKLPTEVVELTCLMPNGVVIPLETNCNITLAGIKEVSPVEFNALSMKYLCFHFNRMEIMYFPIGVVGRS